MTVVIHHPYINQLRFGRHAQIDTARRLPQTGHRPGDMSAVTVVVIGQHGVVDKVDASDHPAGAQVIVQIRVDGNSAIDHGHGDALAAQIGCAIPKLVSANGFDKGAGDFGQIDTMPSAFVVASAPLAG